MKKYCVIPFLVVVLLVTAWGLSLARDFTDEDVAKMIAEAPGPQNYPQAGALVLLSQKSIRFEENGTAVADEYLVAKILQDRGKYKYADIKRRYDKDTDSIVVIKAFSHLADGTIQEVEKKAINDITPAALANAAIYANIMQKVVSFPGIAPGVTIELKLRKYSQAPEEGEEIFLWDTDLFQGDEPISYKEISVTAPAKMPITYEVQNEALNHEVVEADAYVTHTWSIDNAAQIMPEPNMPELSKIAPRLIYTSADSWNKVGSWFAGKFYSHVKTGGEIKGSNKSVAQRRG